MFKKRSLFRVSPFLTAALLIAIFVAQSSAVVYWSSPKSQGESSLFTWIDGGSANGFFGDPTNYESIVDTFKFEPSNFLAETTATIKTATKRDTLQFEVTSKSGSIKGIDIAESGIFAVNGTGSVKAIGTLYVRNLDNAAESTQQALTISYQSGTWTGTAYIDLSSYNWTHIAVSLSDNLFATNSSGLVSSIKKTEVGKVQIIMPEPATLAIFGLGALIFPFTRKKKFSLIALIAVMCVFGFTADSKAVNYVYSSGYSSNSGYFGNPQLDNDNTFIFTGLNFSAESLDGIVSSNDRLTIDIFALPGYEITSVGVEESGEYFIFGNGQVDASGYLMVSSSSSTSTANLNVSPIMPISTESDGYWNGFAYITGLSATSVQVIIDSTLLAQVFDDMSYAAISKIHFSVPVTVRAIPEPATIALLGMGMTIFIARKKNKSRVNKANKIILIICIVLISTAAVQALPIDKNIKNENKASEFAMQLIQLNSTGQNCITVNNQQPGAKASDLITTVRECAASPRLDCQSNVQSNIEIKPANQTHVASLVNSNTPEPSWLK